MKIERVITYIFFLLILFDVLRPQPHSSQQTQQSQEEQLQTQTQINQDQDQDQQKERTIQEDIDLENAEYIESTLPINIEIFYCNRTGLHTQYQELERNIYLTFPKNKNLNVNPGEYPVPEINQQLSKFVNYGQYALMAAMFFHKQLFAMFSLPVPAIVEKIVEKKMFVLIGAIFLVQQLQNSLLTTGKMMVYVDSKLILDQAAPIQIDKVFQLIKTELLQLQ
ncbi:unnamed protein product [Paramecium sonneborni]|uniref:Selenoprotein T n=1 Tax=Paramecium sonneborni TaxID=65129 RepID=A0A8S1QSQ8_9CILI|nr:unnamed protein product [Paramecium sonneborni]